MKSLNSIPGASLLITLVISAPAQSNDPAETGHTRLSASISEYAEIIDSVCSVLKDEYIFPNKAREMEIYLMDRLAEEAYGNIGSLSEFCQVLQDDLRSVCHDGHLEIMEMLPESDDVAGTETDEEQRQRDLERRQRKNFDFVNVRVLPGNVGYLKLNAFHAARDAGGTATAAMNFLAYSDALIIDLRDNTGGFPSMVQLISTYFFDDAVHLNSFYIQKEDTTIQFWTQEYVPGPRMSEILLYLLTSNLTVSASEEFAYNLQSMKRAKIVGETTEGSAHPSRKHFFPNLGVGMWIPFGRPINPITGTDWEGKGVIPDISSSADSALDVAYILALDSLLDMEDDEMRRRALIWPLDSLEANQNPFRLEPDGYEQYIGTYGPRRIWSQDGVLYYQRDQNSPRELVPMKKDLFRLKGISHFRIKFERNDREEITELVGLYNSGRSESNRKTR